MAHPTKEMRCACTQPNSPNKWRFKIAWRYYYYYYCRLLYFCWLSFCLYVPLICDGDWRLRLTGWQQSQHVPTHTHIIDFGFVISFTAISQVDVFARKTRLNNAFFLRWNLMRKRIDKKGARKQNKIHARYDDRRTNCTAIQWFRPENCLVESALFSFWLMASHKFYRSPTAKRRNRISWHGRFRSQLFSDDDDDDSLQTIELNNEKRYSLGDNLINTLRIAHFAI